MTTQFSCFPLQYTHVRIKGIEVIMRKEFISKFKEGCLSVLPIAAIVILLAFVSKDFAPDDVSVYPSRFGPVLVSFVISVVPLIIGMALFNIGAEKSTGKIGTLVGKTLTKRKSLILLLVIGLLMGFMATMAEPDLGVLAGRLFPADSGMKWIFICVGALGVGVFLTVAIIRVILDKSIKYWLTMGYGLVFMLGVLADPDFFSVMFDAGGVTTGPVTVPFILSLGVGVASVLGGNNAEDDSFGYSGLCSLGTVLAISCFSVILRKLGLTSIENSLGLAVKGGDPTQGIPSLFYQINGWESIAEVYLEALKENLINVGLSILPILIFFLGYNIFLKLHKKEFWSIIIGLVYVYIGLVLFLFAAESGLMSVAYNLGQNFAGVSSQGRLWEVLVVCFLFGFISMLAEPSVHVLADQVSEVSRGSINKPTIFLALCMSTGLAIMINVFRTTFNIDMAFFVVPLLLIALALAFLSPDIYVSIAIDSAGVATGTMASCFFLPMFIGYAKSLYLNDSQFGKMILRNGFGIVGIMSLLPIICMEIVGISSVVRTKFAYRRALRAVFETDDSQIIHLPC